MQKYSNYPKDTNKGMFIESGANVTIHDIIERCRVKWGNDVDLSDIEVSAHKIQVNAIEYDLYDANDYIDFILVAMKD